MSDDREKVDALIKRNGLGLADILLRLAEDPSVAVNHRIAAANSLLDRGFGRPPYADTASDERVDLQERLLAALENRDAD